ncbi:peptidase, m16 family [hydrocarbon metagenome]|uniref:Peptidase, m16 family n=1 Tax=hydrocarbon metagenome TaxID=938273 RepID=A0A0W8FZR0_9ZZZZ
MQNHKITILPSGIRIISETLPYVKSFSLGFWFNVGTRDENDKNNGISHFIEHMLFKGTTNRSASKIADEIESLGGYLNAFTSKEHTCYYGRGLSRHIEKTFEVLADMIQNPSFKNSEIKKEAGVIVDELNDIEDNPEELIFDKFESLLFEGNNLSRPIIGTEKNILAFKRHDLFNFINEHYTFDNLFIVASGAVQHENLVEYAEKYFTKDLGKDKRRRNEVRLNNTQDLHVFKEIQQSHFIIGKPTYGYNDKKRVKVSLLSHLLGEGSSSRLFQSIREKNGIAYQVNSFLNSFFDISTFGVYLSTSDKMINKAVDIIESEFKKLRTKKISKKELSKAKEYFKGSIYMSLESTTNRMIRLANSMIYFNKVKSLNDTILEIDSITTNDILEISNELLNENSMNKVVISSKNILLYSAA